MESCSDARFGHLLATARRQALRAGIRAEDAEDCAIEFAEAYFASLPRDINCAEAWISWIWRCARNHAINRKRRQMRLRRREGSWPETTGEHGEAPGAWDCPGAAVDPQAALLQEECRRQLFRALLQLKPVPRELFVRRFFDDESVANLARSTGRSSEAVRKILLRAVKHVREALERCGWTQIDVCLSLAPPRKHVSLAARLHRWTRWTRWTRTSSRQTTNKRKKSPVLFCRVVASCKVSLQNRPWPRLRRRNRL